MSDDVKLLRLSGLVVCEMCIDGKGAECHVPGCFYCRYDVPPAMRDRLQDYGVAVEDASAPVAEEQKPAAPQVSAEVVEAQQVHAWEALKSKLAETWTAQEEARYLGMFIEGWKALASLGGTP